MAETPYVVAPLITDMKQAYAEGYAAGRAEVLAMVRELPSPIKYYRAADDGGPCPWVCEWCHVEMFGTNKSHPSNGCLFVLAQETGKGQA